MVTENEFEKKLLSDVIPPSDIGVTFDDIGALEHVKDTLKELVMLPLQRPELFCKGQLTKVRCRVFFFIVMRLCIVCGYHVVEFSSEIWLYVLFGLSIIRIRLLFFSLAREYFSLGLLVLEKRCLQRLLQLRLVQILSTYQCPVSPQRYFVHQNDDSAALFLQFVLKNV